MHDPATSKASYDDLLALPEGQVGEILGGELYAHPRPAPRHARASSALGFKVGGRCPSPWAPSGPRGVALVRPGPGRR